jgi:hypothetical protein
MGFLLIFSMVALLTYANVDTVRSFIARRARPPWWEALAAAWAVGAVVGVWSGVFFEYRPVPNLRVFGAPIPAAFFHWEGPPGEEQWVDFITPAPLLFAGSNVVILALLAASPVGLAFRFRRRVLTTPGSATADLLSRFSIGVKRPDHST